MAKIETIITDHLDVWSSAIKQRNTQGRGSSKKQELYGIQKLRELILELAVRGLLVPQQETKASSERLVDAMKLAKVNAIAEQRIRKAKPLPKIDAEETPKIPDNWSVMRFGDAFNVINGRAYKKHEMLDEGTPLLRVGNLFTSNQWYYSDLELEPDKYIEKGDLIYAWSASFGPFIWDGEKVIYHYHIWKLDFYKAECLDKYFVNIFLQAITEEIKASGHGIAMVHMTKEKMEKLVLVIPPLEEQKRIVEKVDELMALCDQLEERQENSITAHQQLVEVLLAALTQATDAETFQQAWTRLAANFDTLFTTENSIEQLKQTLLQLAVMGKLVPQDPNDEPASVALEKLQGKYSKAVKSKPLSSPEEIVSYPFELPENWAWVRFPELGEWGRGKSKHRPRNDRALFKDGRWPLIQTGDVANANGLITSYSKAYSDFGLEQSKLWPKGTMCITIAANIADSAFLGIDACFPDSVVGLVPDSMFDGGKYFEYFIRTAKQNLTDYAPSTAQKNINLGILEQVNIPMPPTAEQKRIVEKVDQLFAICDQLKEKIRTAEETQLQLADALTSQAIK